MICDYLTFIKGRMDELGHNQYNIHPMRMEFESGESVQYLKAHNEYLYLLSENIPAEIIIHSDTEIFYNVTDELNMYLPQEFSGMVSFESSSLDNYSLEFIRVIPK